MAAALEIDTEVAQLVELFFICCADTQMPLGIENSHYVGRMVQSFPPPLVFCPFFLALSYAYCLLFFFIFLFLNFQVIPSTLPSHSSITVW